MTAEIATVTVPRSTLLAVDRALRHLPMHDDDCGSCDRIAQLTHEIADVVEKAIGAELAKGDGRG